MVIKTSMTSKGLPIGGYGSAWLADLVAAFVLKNTAQFFNEAVYDMESTETMVLLSLKRQLMVQTRNHQVARRLPG
jgi:hypothetical protein